MSGRYISLDQLAKTEGKKRKRDPDDDPPMKWPWALPIHMKGENVLRHIGKVRFTESGSSPFWKLNEDARKQYITQEVEERECESFDKEQAEACEYKLKVDQSIDQTLYAYRKFQSTVGVQDAGLLTRIAMGKIGMEKMASSLEALDSIANAVQAMSSEVRDVVQATDSVASATESVSNSLQHIADAIASVSDSLDTIAENMGRGE